MNKKEKNMHENLQMKTMSSLEKCFLDDNLADKQETTNFTILRNQPLACQVGVFCTDRVGKLFNTRATVRLSGVLAPYATVRAVVSVPNHFPCTARALEAD